MFLAIIIEYVGCSGPGTKATGKCQSVQGGEIAPRQAHADSSLVILRRDLHSLMRYSVSLQTNNGASATAQHALGTDNEDPGLVGLPFQGGETDQRINMSYGGRWREGGGGGAERGGEGAGSKWNILLVCLLFLQCVTCPLSAPVLKKSLSCAHS